MIDSFLMYQTEKFGQYSLKSLPHHNLQLMSLMFTIGIWQYNCIQLTGDTSVTVADWTRVCWVGVVGEVTSTSCKPPFLHQHPTIPTNIPT